MWEAAKAAGGLDGKGAAARPIARRGKSDLEGVDEVVTLPADNSLTCIRSMVNASLYRIVDCLGPPVAKAHVPSWGVRPRVTSRRGHGNHPPAEPPVVGLHPAVTQVRRHAKAHPRSCGTNTTNQDPAHALTTADESRSRDRSNRGRRIETERQDVEPKLRSSASISSSQEILKLRFQHFAASPARLRRPANSPRPSRKNPYRTISAEGRSLPWSGPPSRPSSSRTSRL